MVETILIVILAAVVAGTGVLCIVLNYKGEDYSKSETEK